ncbi:hypothetical protein MNB_SV-4-1104 [hydrothermal vent metagenome]|uniref:Uncharacterized protein n=1 Tax=hydrothermal vent metagenome TaxID=652676 RepID=A0A1W1E925_9ZZZZ
MGKHPRWFWIFNGLFLSLMLLAMLFTPVRETLWGWMHEGWDFLRAYTVALLSAFFLVKGKFVLKLFLKKIILFSATGLGKRYLIEKVFTYHLKVHFLDHIAVDLSRLVVHIKKNFIRFPLTKKIIATLAFLGSLGYISKFMGVMLAVKVFIAKIWSFLLAIVLKAGSAILYFWTDYLWGSWLAPIVEVVIFSWLLDLLEKIPFLTGSIRWFYGQMLRLARMLDRVLAKLFHVPMRKIFKWMVVQTRGLIYRFIGYKRVSAYFQLKELRGFQPSRYQKLLAKRKMRQEKRRKRVSRYMQRKSKRDQ